MASALSLFMVSAETRDTPLDPASAGKNHDEYRCYIDAVKSYGKKDGKESDDEDDEDSLCERTAKQCVVLIFGRTAAGESICIRTRFEPSIYLLPPDDMVAYGHEVAERIYLSVYRRAYGCMVSVEKVRRKKFNGFHGDRVFDFLRIRTTSEKAARQCGYAVRKKGLNVWLIDREPKRYEL
jgi:hypothetical protein